MLQNPRSTKSRSSFLSSSRTFFHGPQFHPSPQSPISLVCTLNIPSHTSMLYGFSPPIRLKPSSSTSPSLYRARVTIR